MEKINEIVLIDVSKIDPNPSQPRTIFKEEGIEELANSIKAYGVLQPITVQDNDGKYTLIMGERRLRAAKLLKLSRIPCIVVDAEEKDSSMIALIENIQRIDLTFLEEAFSYKTLLSNYSLTQGDLAKSVGKSQSTIANKLRLLKLSDKALSLLENTNLTERHARALLKLSDENDQVNVIKKIGLKDLTVKETETLIERMLKGHKKTSETYKVNYKIYLNTLKKSFNIIKNMCEASTMTTEEDEDFLQVTIKIPK